MVQHYAPELKKKLDWYKKRYASRWHLDETYVKYLSQRRNAKAAKKFLNKLINNNPNCDPFVMNTDKNPSYTQAIRELKHEGQLASHVIHAQIKYRNNRIEADHGKLKQLINPVPVFQSMKTAYATIKGFQAMRMFSKKANLIFGCVAIVMKPLLPTNYLKFIAKCCPKFTFLTSRYFLQRRQ